MEEKMHPVNKFLSLFGMQLSRTNLNIKETDDNKRAFNQRYEDYYKLVEGNKRGFKAIRTYRYDVGRHPVRTQHLEFEFAAYCLHKINPLNVLDIGSDRYFILGLLAHYNLTTLDFRERKSMLDNENTVTGDAKALEFSDNSFDTVLSLEALPHFGLGRYGDEFDLDADIKAFDEMIRVLIPGGYLIFSTPITRAQPSIAFNARRNYSDAMIKEMCGRLECIEEKFINRRDLTYCVHDDITTDPDFFDYYIGCWQKVKTE
jgi:SAM-dependent methyltransferase